MQLISLGFGNVDSIVRITYFFVLYTLQLLPQTRHTVLFIWARGTCMSMAIIASRFTMVTGTGKQREVFVSEKVVTLFNLEIPACKNTSGLTCFPRNKGQRKTDFGLERRIWIRNLIGDGCQVELINEMTKSWYRLWFYVWKIRSVSFSFLCKRWPKYAVFKLGTGSWTVTIRVSLCQWGLGGLCPHAYRGRIPVARLSLLQLSVSLLLYLSTQWVNYPGFEISKTHIKTPTLLNVLI